MNERTRIHANFVQAQGNPFDIALDFGYRAKGNDPEPEPDVTVTMSWEHLKVLLAALDNLVENYEKEVGPIPDLVAKPEPVAESQKEAS